MRRLVGKSLVALVATLFTTADVFGQALPIDAARDRALVTPVRAFLNDTITADRLERELREFARAFETKPYKMFPAPIAFDAVAQDRLFSFVRVVSRVIGPSQQAYMKGELTAQQAALKMAPFLLIWGGYGMDAPPNDPVARVRIDELLSEIGKLAASDVPFGQVAEGYSSQDESTGANVAPRMFSAPDNVCASAPRPASLEPLRASIELQVGQPFAITRIVVVARDAAGALLSGVPIAIEVELVDPPLLNHRSDATPENHLHPIRAGTFHVRARTICGDRLVSVLIPATAH